MQTVKALIVNSACVEPVNDSFDELENLYVSHVLGNGIPNDEECLDSGRKSCHADPGRFDRAGTNKIIFTCDSRLFVAS